MDNFSIKNSKILLLKGSFEIREIICQEKNLKHKKIMHLINFILTWTFFYVP